MHAHGSLSPSEPKTREYWMSLIKLALSHGVDGMDIRQQGHTNILEWSEYGFSKPIVDEYKKRYGVDILTEDFDREKWRRLRGEYYTQFLREAKQELKKHSKKLQVHINGMMAGTPDTPTTMDIHWNWRQWLDEGIPDAVTFQALAADRTFRNHMGRELIKACYDKSIPIYYRPFVGSAQELKDWTALGMRDSGLNGFVVYESATLYASQADGTIKDIRPGLVAYLKKRQ